jgi:hypothetical protein
MPNFESTGSIFPSEYVSENVATEMPNAAEQVDTILGEFEETAKADYGKSKPYRLVTRAKVIE